MGEDFNVLRLDYLMRQYIFVAMEIEIAESNNKGRAFLGDQAEMTYSRAGDRLLIIDHTWVSDQLRGKGVGDLMLKRLVKYARDREMKILPLCSFAKSAFDRQKELSDVLR